MSLAKVFSGENRMDYETTAFKLQKKYSIPEGEPEISLVNNKPVIDFKNTKLILEVQNRAQAEWIFAVLKRAAKLKLFQPLDHGVETAEMQLLIAQSVIESLKYDEYRIFSRERSHKLVKQRHSVWIALHKEYGFRVIDIARMFEVNHTSVLYGINKEKMKLRRIVREMNRGKNAK